MDPKLVGRLKAITGVRIAPDKLEATLEIRNPGEDLAGVDDATVVHLLALHGVRYGLLAATITAVAAEARAGAAQIGPYTVARGVAPVKGTDGETILQFDSSLKVGEVRANGRIDYRERGAVHQVAQGAILATVKAPIPGTPGRSVEDREIPAPALKPQKALKAGDGVRFDEAQGQFIAETAGHVSFADHTFAIRPLVSVAGDVDYTVGNIRFSGDVAVAGKVATGFTIEAGGSVVVAGDVEPKATVIADGDVTIKGCCRGKSKEEGPSLKAGGRLIVGQLQDATVSAKGDVTVLGLVLNGSIRTLGSLVNNGPEAQIRGSSIEAVKGISAANVGTADGVPTTLVAGITARIADRIHELDEEIAKVSMHLNHICDSFQKKYGDLMKKSTLSAEEQAELKDARVDASAKQEGLERKLHEYKRERAELSEDYREDPAARIEVVGTIYPLANIRVHDQDYILSSEPRSQIVFSRGEKSILCQTKEQYERTQRQAAADPDDLMGRFKRGVLNQIQVAAGLHTYNAIGSLPVLETALGVGLKAVKLRDYQNAVVWGEVALTMTLLARLTTDARTSERLLAQAGGAAEGALQAGGEAPAPLAVQGLLASARGDHGECLRKFRRAFELLHEKRAKFRRDENIYVLYAEFLEGLAARLGTAGKTADEAKFKSEAVRAASEYLSRQPKGQWAPRAARIAPPELVAQS